VSKFVSINFSLVAIRVVKGSLRRGVVKVDSATTMTEQEFDEFLSSDKCESYIVSANVKELFQEVIYLPTVDEKLLASLVRMEIGKLHSDLKNYSCYYEIIGDSLHEGRSLQQIVCFIYSNDDLAPLISRFTHHRKRIKYLCSTAYALSRLVASCPEATDEAMLCIEGSVGEKSLFLMENRKLYFVRNIQSNTAGIDKMDALNINMTIDFCLQSLRVKPQRVVVLGAEEQTQDDVPNIMLPLQRLAAPAMIDVAPHILWEYTVPIASLLCQTSIRHGTILPQVYREQSRSMDILRFGAYMLAFCCILTGLGVAMKAYSIIGLHENITILRKSSVSNERIYMEYTRLYDELAGAVPMITAINKAAAQTKQLQSSLALRCLIVPGIRASTLTIKRKDDLTLAIEFKGDLQGTRYSEAQTAFESLIASIKATGSLEIVTSKMDPVTRTFTLELLYKA
jgi:hypothetical protein